MAFSGFPAEALTFYAGLEADNSRTYWLANRAVYDRSVKGAMAELAEALGDRFTPVHVFRPNRDVRFSNDKSPYKTQCGAVRDEGLAAAGPPAAILEVGADVQRAQVREGPLQPRREVGGLDRRMGAVELLVMDELGAITIVDRKKDMILVSGFNVYPNEIEAVVSTLDGVLQSAAVGVPDEKTGEAIKLFVVRTQANLGVEEVAAHCRTHLTAYKCPKYIEFRESLPMSTVGKILRRELKS